MKTIVVAALAAMVLAGCAQHYTHVGVPKPKTVNTSMDEVKPVVEEKNLPDVYEECHAGDYTASAHSTESSHRHSVKTSSSCKGLRIR
jgi:entry exclusion lipoprotein TrbK